MRVAVVLLVCVAASTVWAADDPGVPVTGACAVKDTTVVLRWGADVVPIVGNAPTIMPRNLIHVFRDGQQIAILPAEETTYIDLGVPRGLHAYRVIAVLDGLELLLLECRVLVEPGAGPHDLICSVNCVTEQDPAGTIAGSFCNVNLTWVNGANAYLAILIVRDGACVALLPGATERWVDLRTAPGTHTYLVYGVVRGVLPAEIEDAILGGTTDPATGTTGDVLPLVCPHVPSLTPPASCTVTVPDEGSVPGPRDLRCIVLDVTSWDQVPEIATTPRDTLPPTPFRGVLLIWQNGAFYDTIRITRDNAVIAVVPGRTWYYLDPNVPAGAHVYTVRGVVDGRPTSAARCEVRVPGPGVVPPPQDLVCNVVCIAADPNADGSTAACTDCPTVCTVALSWRNPCAYDAIHVSRDGEAVARLPGTAMRWIDAAPLPDSHVYKVRGLRGGAASEPAACTVLVPPPPPVLPPRGLTCAGVCTTPEPVSPCTVLLAWHNPQKYDAILIARNGEKLMELPGDAVQYADENVPEGTHTYAVSGIAGDLISKPAVCRISVPEPPLAPPRDLVCLTNIGPEPTPMFDAAGGLMPTPLNAVFLRWRNPCRYDTVLVRRDGEVLAKLPGESTAYTDLDVAPGEHVYAVSGVRGNAETEAVSCTVRVGVPIPPPSNLVCTLLPTESDPTAEDGIVGPAVALTWENPQAYDAILLFRNRCLIAKLPGDTQRYVDRGLLPGVYVYSLVGVSGPSQSVPAVCRIDVPGPVPPPQDLTCEVLPVNCLVGPDCPPGVVSLAWRNPARYAAIVILRDGEELAQLPGDQEHFLDRRIAAGAVYVYDVMGVTADGTRTPPATCKIEIPPFPPAPPYDLVCEAGATSVKLAWRNGGVYAAVVIGRDGTKLAELEGAAQAYYDQRVEAGEHCYAVVGITADGVATAAARCCVVVQGNVLSNVLYFAANTIDDTQTVPSGTAICVGDNKDALEGWSFGVCNDPALIVPVDAVIDGTFAAALNGGKGPGFLWIDITEAGVTMAAIVQTFDPTGIDPAVQTSIEPGRGRSLLAISYEAKRAAAAASDVIVDGLYRLSYCNRLGDPTVPVVYVVGGYEVKPDVVPGTVRIPPPAQTAFIRGDANADGGVDIGDVIAILGYLFGGAADPVCLAAADANHSHQINIADPIYLLNFLFVHGPTPPAPYPDCGVYVRDSTAELSCDAFPPCAK